MSGSYTLNMSTRGSDYFSIRTCPMMHTLRSLYPHDRGLNEPMRKGTRAHSAIESLTKGNAATARIDGLPASVRSSVDQWQRTVPPWAENRHPIYEGYEWPPRVELKVRREHPDLSYPATGTIDALFQGPDGYLLIDYKRGRNIPDEVQLQHYLWVANLDGPVRIAYHRLEMQREDSIIAEFEPWSEGKIVKAIRGIERWKESIVQRKVAPAKEGWQCERMCDMVAQCPTKDPGNMPDVTRRLRLVTAA